MARLSILIFHRVLHQADPLQPDIPDAACFRALMAWTARLFHVVPLEEAVARLGEGTLPARAVAVTFDDGYADNAELAMPILRNLGLPATFFVASGYLDGGCMWNDAVIEAVRRWPEPVLDCPEAGLEGVPVESPQQRRNALRAMLPRIKYLDSDQRNRVADRLLAQAGCDRPDLMMNSDQVRELHREGMTIGGHTVSHPILARISSEQARTEMQSGKATLEDIIGQAITLFAYPNGKPAQDYRPEHARLAEEVGFKAAVSTAVGTAGPRCDVYQLPRFTPWDRTPLRFGARLLWQRLRSVS